MSSSFPTITDVHLSLGKAPSVIFPNQQIAGPEHKPLIQALTAAIEKNPNSKLIEIEDSVDGITKRWRVQLMRPGRYAMRCMRTSLPNLDDLTHPDWIKARLLTGRSVGTGGGLIMILGPTGGGKTTTFSATISGRLKLNGGYALTIEDPPEDALDGQHGNGWCDQLDADELGGYEKAMKVALRCFPAKDNSILGYGEVLENSTAAHLLRVALDGHLVIFTTHAKSISAGISRLISMAEMAGEVGATEMLISSLTLAVHQRFDDKKKFIAKAISPDDCPPLKSHIANRNFPAIEQEVDTLHLRNLRK
jgi:twitching motility protein PilT